MKISLKIFCVLCFFSSGLVLADSHTETSKYDKLVVILIDTLRADHLPIYGYSINTAPFLQKIADEGVVFENGFSTSSWTAPATASLHSSLYPFQHGLVMGFHGLKRLKQKNSSVKVTGVPQKIEMIAESLKAAGYKTFAVTDNQNICEKRQFNQGFDHFSGTHNAGGEVVMKKLTEWKDMINASKKYFLYIHFQDPHHVYQQRQPWFDQYAKYPNVYRKWEEQKYRDRVRAYDSEIRFVDNNVQTLFDWFQWSSDTMLFVTSDHGEEFWDHGGTGHGNSLHQELMHVPFFYWIAGKKIAKRVTENVSLVDVAPTLRDAAGLAPHPEHQGISLLGYTEKNVVSGVDKNRLLFGHLDRERSSGMHSKQYASLQHSTKFIRDQIKTQSHLYDFIQDPEEKKNLLEEQFSRAEQLNTEYQNYSTASQAPRYEPEHVPYP